MLTKGNGMGRCKERRMEDREVGERKGEREGGMGREWEGGRGRENVDKRRIRYRGDLFSNFLCSFLFPIFLG